LFSDLIDQNGVFIVAEIGNNHNGDPDTAKKLIDAAAAAGVDAVKFQTFRGLDIVSPRVAAHEYKDWNIEGFDQWYQFLDSIALPFDKHAEVFQHASQAGVIPFSTPTSTAAVALLESIGTRLYKIASMDVTNVQLLEAVSRTGKPVILSTGMALEEEITLAVDFFDRQNLAVLHCVSDYPLNPQDANLRSIAWLKERFGCPVGFSDHSLGNELVTAAVAMGAVIIEKHITLDRQSTRKAEHHFALEPAELKQMVKKIRLIEAALGAATINLSHKERDLREKARRSLHATRELKSGHTLEPEDIAIVRPGDGAPPQDYAFFIGKVLDVDVSAWAPINKEVLKLS